MKLFDTFAGVGGFRLALEQAIGKENVNCIGFSEIDKFAKQTYLSHRPDDKDYGDITKIDIDNLPVFDLLTGGFPCQSFSIAGKQEGFGCMRGQMIYYLLSILEKKKPKYFVFENVKMFMSKKYEAERQKIFDIMKDLGYEIKYKVLNTKEHGLPQNRERVFIVGCLDKLDFEFPQPQELKIFLKDILEKEVDEKFYMTKEQYDKLGYESLKRIYDKVAPTLDTAQGEHRQPKVLMNRYNKRLMENVSGTLGCYGGFTNKQGYQVVEGTQIRKLTPKEYERLQGFPDGRTSTCSNTQRYKQMGNAISVNVVRKLFNNL